MTILLWIAFVVLVLGLLALDLGVLNKTPHAISTTEAAIWTAFWIVLALAFNVGVYFIYRFHVFGIGEGVEYALTARQAGLQFLTGYLIEKSLSLDNIFVIALIFAYFQIPQRLQHRVLFWGILGAMIMRGIMIALGTALIHRFEWITYVFGAVLLITAVRMLLSRHDRIDPDKSLLVRGARRLYPVTFKMEGPHFFSDVEGRRHMTPLFLALLVVEGTDLVFAVDSIPAVFAVTRDPFIVFTSNIFAILGLRSLYFVLAGVLARFRYLKLSLVIILGFVAVKMLLAQHVHIPVGVSLGVICGILALGIAASIIARDREGSFEENETLAELRVAADATWKQVRRALILLLGASVILVGIALLVLPGPAFVVIPAGLAILATEFLWARRLMKRMKEGGLSLFRSMRGTNREPSGADASDARRMGNSPEGN